MNTRATEKNKTTTLKNALAFSSKLENIDAKIAALVDERKEVSKNFIQHVREYRRAARYTTYDLARLTGLTQGMVAYMEQGKRSVTSASLSLIRNWLNDESRVTTTRQ